LHAGRGITFESNSSSPIGTIPKVFFKADDDESDAPGWFALPYCPPRPALGAAPGGGLVAVISPLDNFKSTMLGKLQAGGAGAAAGVSGYTASLPLNFSTSTIVVFGAAGITDAVHAWGAALLARNGGGAKVADPTSTQLTYWTDSESRTNRSDRQRVACARPARACMRMH
jgi:hypothetical protein